MSNSMVCFTVFACLFTLSAAFGGSPEDQIQEVTGLCDSLPETPMFYGTAVYDPARPMGTYDPARACDEEEDGTSFVNNAGSMCDNSYSFVPENDNNNCQNTNFRGVTICFGGDTVCIDQLQGMESTWCRGRVTKCKAKEGGDCTDDESYSPCDDA